MTDDDRVYTENVAGYGFLLMVLFILMAISPLIIIVPVTVWYTWKSFKWIHFENLLIKVQPFADRLKVW